MYMIIYTCHFALAYYCCTHKREVKGRDWLEIDQAFMADTFPERKSIATYLDMYCTVHRCRLSCPISIYTYLIYVHLLMVMAGGSLSRQLGVSFGLISCSLLQLQQQQLCKYSTYMQYSTEGYVGMYCTLHKA